MVNFPEVAVAAEHIIASHSTKTNSAAVVCGESWRAPFRLGPC